MADTFTHPTIGQLRPNTSHEGVLQFQGLQYATLTDRFAPAKLKEYSKDEVIDATKVGPQVLSMAPGPTAELGLIGHTLPFNQSDYELSDTEGLCLNLTIPSPGPSSLDSGTQLTSGIKLPVFVFIHGGGFNVGTGMSPQYNMAKFVELSVRAGKPVIGVAMNYRTGAPGMLTSKALREKGYLPNNGFRDQRTALKWLTLHLSGFGGDPENITLAGESAGGISVCYHLFSEEKLFKRMVSMSGTQLLMPPITPEIAQTNYEKALKTLGLGDNDAGIEALTKGLDGQAMTQKLMGAGTPYIPVLDNDLVPSAFNFKSIQTGSTAIPGLKWCEAAIIGDCQFDGNIQGLRLMNRKKGIAASFCESITSSLPSHSSLAQTLLAAYEIHPDTSDDEAMEKVLQIATDLNFYLPTLTLAERMKEAGTKTFVYRFNEPNPWEGPWKGKATHILDIAFLLQNFNAYLSTAQAQLAENFAKDVITFVNGEAPWEQWQKAKVLGPEGKVAVEDDVPERVGRRDIIQTLAKEVGLDAINDAFEVFMKGAKPPHAD